VKRARVVAGLIAVALGAAAWVGPRAAASAPPDSSAARPAHDIDAAPASVAADSARGRLTFHGRVTDAGGHPVGLARVTIEGSRRALVTTGATGEFTISVATGDLDGLRRSPIELWLAARRVGYRIALAGGAPRLGLEIRARDDRGGVRHVIVRSNDSAVTAQVARAIKEDGALAASVAVRLIGVAGKGRPSREFAMDRVADVVIPAGRSTPAASNGANAGDATAARASGGDSSSAAPGHDASSAVAPAVPSLRSPAPAALIPPPVPASLVLADTARRAPRPSPARDSAETVRRLAADSCQCRVDGTIEVRWDQSLPEPVPVGLWIDDAPTARDSVQLQVGLPSAFQLLVRGCGLHRIEFETYSRVRFSLVSPLPQVDCLQSGPLSIRIVLTLASRVRP